MLSPENAQDPGKALIKITKLQGYVPGVIHLQAYDTVSLPQWLRKSSELLGDEMKRDIPMINDRHR